MVRLTSRLRDWAQAIKRDVHAICLASRDPRTPWHAKAIAVAVAAYALSPIDLIPDFIPIFGQLDDLVIVPLGIWLAVRLIPTEVMQQHRAAAALLDKQGPGSIAGAVAIVMIWVALTALAAWLVYRCFVT